MKFLLLTMLLIAAQTSHALNTICRVNTIRDEGTYERINNFTFDREPFLVIHLSQCDSKNLIGLSIGKTTFADKDCGNTEGDTGRVTANILTNGTQIFSAFHDIESPDQTPDLTVEIKGKVATVHYLDSGHEYMLGNFICE
ncbi:MAG: hypothetical protein H7328_00810 [Bdellovibrio sp.]|nr:hypothetical protein [Bdellovibrio sp.]